MKSLLLSILLAWTCYAPTPLFLLQNGATTAAPWTPADLGSRLLEWVKADSESYSDNAPVPTMTDRSPSGRNFTQATISKQPTFKTNIQNGLPGYYHDGGDGCLTTSWAIPRHAGIVMALEISTGGMLCEGGTSNPWYFLNPNGQTYRQGQTGDNVNLGAGWLGTTETVIAAYTTSTAMFVRKDGTTLGSTASTVTDTTANDTLSIFSRGASSFFITGYLFEFVLIDDPTATDIANTEAYLKNKWKTP